MKKKKKPCPKTDAKKGLKKQGSHWVKTQGAVVWQGALPTAVTFTIRLMAQKKQMYGRDKSGTTSRVILSCVFTNFYTT